MAGIFAIFKKHKLSDSLEKKLLDCSSKLKHRGPTQKFNYNKFPLQIVFYQDGKFRKDISLNFAVNNESIILIDGKIYNLNSKDNSRNDNNKLEKLLIKFKKQGIYSFKPLLGSYSGILYHENELFGFKDAIGAKPLYYCDTDDCFIFSSEMKGLTPLESDIFPVSPGYLISSSRIRLKFNFFSDFVKDYKLTKGFVNNIIKRLNNLIKKVVSDNLHKHEEICTFLSGGIDSTIITHIAQKYIDNLKVYSVGVDGSNDLRYAKNFAHLNNLDYNELKINFEDIKKSIKDVIYALESFDAALIRSAIPMFLLSEYVHKENNMDVVLTGEGGDELFGGYDYLAQLKSKKKFNKELTELFEIEHITGLQRVDRIPYHFSMEARAPLFDYRLVEFSLKIPPELKIFKNRYGIAKKWILRKAFEDESPEEFIWRRKQKFSDGAGSQFLFKEYISSLISDDELNEEKQIHNDIILRTKEELYYWRIFEDLFNPTDPTIEQIGITKNYEI